MLAYRWLPIAALVISVVMRPSPAGAAKSVSGGKLVSGMVTSLDGWWLLAPDPQNVGREQKWFTKPTSDAKPAKVPWIIQEAFPGYHGVAWYWKDFSPPANLDPGGRFVLRFWAVDYLADVWVNGVHVGGHEGGETPFELDVTDAVRSNASNRLAVRVLNPTDEPIDGFVMDETPRRCKVMPYRPGAGYNHGGITDSVELFITPAVRVQDIFARPDTKTGVIRVSANVRNASGKPASGRIVFGVAPAASGETLATHESERKLAPGDTGVEAELKVEQPRLWDLNDPFLYRVTARVEAPAFGTDERSTRCGFRDFRFENGYFRLNGRRIYVRSAHTCNHFPVGLQFPHDPDLARRDLLNHKVMGFNMVRFIWGGALRYQLDLCDEIGLLVYEETYAAIPMLDSPKMAERFDRSVAEIVRRDRNHPSIVMWGLLNETQDTPVFRHAVSMLPMVRKLDETRMVMLNSGRWDGRQDIGSLSNPHSNAWEPLLGSEHAEGEARSGSQAGDMHFYPRVPQTAGTIQHLRTIGHGGKHIFLTEYGVGSAVDLWRTVRHFEQLGKESLEDGQFFTDRLNEYLADYRRWRLEDVFAQPVDFFAQSLRKMAGQRTQGMNAIRANPYIVGYSLTGMIDHVMTGEGLTTAFREMKPGTVDALHDAWAPLRLCLFAEPVNIYRGSKVRFEAVLANEDALAPGDYPLRLQVIAPDGARVLDRTMSLTIPKGEQPLAVQVFTEEIAVDGPPGRYRFVADFQRGGAAAGGETEIYVADRADMPAVEAEIALWGEDADLARWLSEHGIKTRALSGAQTAREVVLVSGKAPQDPAAWRELAQWIARGSTAIFLTPGVFAKGDAAAARLPLANKGSIHAINSWLYLKDEWAKRHPIFDGLPSGGLMDPVFYREIIPDLVMSGQDPPAEAIAGAVKASQGYESGLMLSAYDLGAGRFVLNTLLIRENLGTHPAAERLLRNMLRYAARDAGKPLADLPAGFNDQLAAMGY